MMSANHRAFEVAAKKHLAGLSAEARYALLGLFQDFAHLADLNAQESARRHKYAMYAYWKIVAVYARRFHRLTIHASGARPKP